MIPSLRSWRGWAVAVVLAVAGGGGALAQYPVAGVGPAYAQPLGTLGEASSAGVGGALSYEARSWCDLWTGFRLSYVRFDSTLVEPRATWYESAAVFAPQVRYFPWKPMTSPLYLQAMLQASRIAASDSLTSLGLGAGIGVGYLLGYTSDCCSWFVDLSAQLHAPNAILRADGRASITYGSLGASFHFAL